MDLIESFVGVSYNDGISPIKNKEMEAPLYFYEIERAFDIQTDSICIMVNDVVLDSCNENTVFNAGDRVQVFRILQGGASGKRTLATIIQLGAAIAAAALTIGTGGAGAAVGTKVLAVAIAVSGSLAGQYFLRKAAKLEEKDDAKIESNIFSAVSARNQARPLEYLPMTFGEVRYSPDYIVSPYSRFLYGVNQTNFFYPGPLPEVPSIQKYLYSSEFTRARIIIADAPSTIPSGVVYNQGLEIILSGTNINITGVSGTLLPLNNRREVFLHDKFRDAVGLGVDQYVLLVSKWSGPVGSVTNKNIIVVITGSVFATFTLSALKTNCRIYAPNNLSPDELTHLQNNFPDVRQTWNTGGTVTAYNTIYWNLKSDAMTENLPILFGSDVPDDYSSGSNLVGGPLGYFAGTSFTSVSGSTTAFGKSLLTTLGSVYRTFAHENVNGLNYTENFGPANSNKILQNSPVFINNLAAYTAVTPRQMVIHSFCFGLGDLFISNRKLENTPLAQLNNTYFSETAKIVSFKGWGRNNIAVPEINQFIVPEENVKVFEGGELLSSPTISFPDNAIIRELPDNTFRVEVDIEGQLLKSDGAGYSDNQATIACYIENTLTNARIYMSFYTDGPTLTPLTDNFTVIGNNKQRIRATISTYLSGIALFPNHRIVVYKLTLDPDDNEKVEQLSVTSIKAYRRVNYIPDVFSGTKHYAENTEGLVIMSTNKSQEARTYSAIVKAKIWKYRPLTDDYAWDYSSNPADVFLTMALGYYATGINHATSGETFPTSPTIGFTTGNRPDAIYRIAGLGYAIDQIDLASIKAWWIFCNSKGINFNYTFTGEETGMSALSLIAARGRGSVDFYRTGKLSIIWEEETPVEFVFGMSNIELDSFNIQYSLGQIPYKIKGTFSNKDKDYQADSVEFEVPYAEIDELNILELPLPGVTSIAEAEAEVKIACYRTWYNRKTYTFTTGQEGAQLSRGTRIYVSHDILNHTYSDRVHCFTVDETNGEVLTANVDLMQEMPGPLWTLTKAIVRYVDNTISTFDVTIDEMGLITFVGATKPDASLFPHYMSDIGEENPFSITSGTIQEDVIIHLGQPGGLGQLAKIIEVQPQDDRTDDGQAVAFTVRAIPDDPILYSAEYDYSPVPLPMADAPEILISKIINVVWTQEGETVTFWVDGLNCTGFKVETQSGIPLLVNGGTQSTTSTNFTIDMLPGQYDLRIIPYITGIAYQSIPYEFSLEVL